MINQYTIPMGVHVSERKEFSKFTSIRKNIKLDSQLTSYNKRNSRCIKDLNIKCKIINNGEIALRGYKTLEATQNSVKVKQINICGIFIYNGNIQQ